MTFTAAAWCNLMMQFFFPLPCTPTSSISPSTISLCYVSAFWMKEGGRGGTDSWSCFLVLTRFHKQPALVELEGFKCCLRFRIFSHMRSVMMAHPDQWPPAQQYESLVWQETTPEIRKNHPSLPQLFWESRVVEVGIKSIHCDVTKGIVISPRLVTTLTRWVFFVFFFVINVQMHGCSNKTELLQEAVNIGLNMTFLYVWWFLHWRTKQNGTGW